MATAAKPASLLVLSAIGLGLLLAASPAPEAAPAPASPPAEARTFEVDGVHSTALFRVMHLGVSYAYGRFGKLGGEIVLSEDEGGSSVRIEIDTASVDTGSEKRDDHLRSPDFFSATEFPTLSFESSSVKAAGEDRYAVTGTLTLHGVSKEVRVDVVKTGEGKGMRDSTLIGFETTFEILRSDYGMDFMVPNVGDEVRITLSIEAGMR
jgi:polyisoprenoid-binding protein YceI